MKTTFRKANQEIFLKMKSQSVQLGLLYSVGAGIQTGADKFTNRHFQKYRINATPGEGIFILNDKEIEKLNLSETELKYLKPWFDNSSILRWIPRNKTEERIIYIDRGHKSISEKLKRHLSRFKSVLDKRREVENGTIEWWKLQWPRIEKIFNEPKIIACKWSERNFFSYCEKPWFASVNITFISNKHSDDRNSLKYLIGLLNSKLYYFWLYNNGKRAGNRLMLDPKPLMEVPIKQVSTNKQEPFIELVDRILTAKRVNPQADTSQLEREIDQLVYQLYGLTPEEIAIVEESTRAK